MDDLEVFPLFLETAICKHVWKKRVSGPHRIQWRHFPTWCFDWDFRFRGSFFGQRIPGSHRLFITTGVGFTQWNTSFIMTFLCQFRPNLHLQLSYMIFCVNPYWLGLKWKLPSTEVGFDVFEWISRSVHIAKNKWFLKCDTSWSHKQNDQLQNLLFTFLKVSQTTGPRVGMRLIKHGRFLLGLPNSTNHPYMGRPEPL